MTHDAEHQPMWWSCMNLVVILVSLILATYPPSQRLAALIIPFDLIFLPIYFILYIRREKASGDLDMSLRELYRRIRGGHRLRDSTLETLAGVALLFASISIATR